MDIKEEQINKLSQLDRIEYRQKEHDLKCEYYPIILNRMLILLGGFLIIYLSAMIMNYLVNGVVLELPTTAPIVIVCVGVIGHFTELMLRNKKLKDLEREYFDTIVKKK